MGGAEVFPVLEGCQSLGGVGKGWSLRLHSLAFSLHPPIVRRRT
jgi:hypothetical protein